MSSRPPILHLIFGGLRQREIGALLGVDYSAVSVSRRRFQAAMNGNRILRAIMARAEKRIGQGQGRPWIPLAVT